MLVLSVRVHLTFSFSFNSQIHNNTQCQNFSPSSTTGSNICLAKNNWNMWTGLQADHTCEQTKTTTTTKRQKTCVPSENNVKKRMHGRERERTSFLFRKCFVTHFGHYVKPILPTVWFKCINLWSFRVHAEPSTLWPHYIQGMLQVVV